MSSLVTFYWINCLTENTLPLICMSLNKNRVYSILSRSEKNVAEFKQ